MHRTPISCPISRRLGCSYCAFSWRGEIQNALFLQVTNMSGLLLNLCVLWDIHCYQLMFQIYYEIQKRVLVWVMYQLNFEKSTILTPPHDFLSSTKFLHVLLKLEQFFHKLWLESELCDLCGIGSCWAYIWCWFHANDRKVGAVQSHVRGNFLNYDYLSCIIYLILQLALNFPYCWFCWLVRHFAPLW